MRIYAEDSLCLLVDMQERLMPAMNHKEECIKQAIMLLKGLSILEIPILVSQQYTKGLGMTLPEIFAAAGTEEYLDKRTFSCYMDEGIKNALEKEGKKQVIILGAEAHVCVLQTCIDLKAAGYQPVLVLDCIASRKEESKSVAIKRAMQEGVIVTTAEALLFELTVDSRAEHFKEISALVK